MPLHPYIGEDLRSELAEVFSEGAIEAFNLIWLILISGLVRRFSLRTELC
jgi:hypothetical protein